MGINDWDATNIRVVIMSEDNLRLELITNYWREVGIIRVHDANNNNFVGRAVGFFNGFFMLVTIEGGRVWIDIDSIVSIREMGILIGPEPDKEAELEWYEYFMLFSY